MKLFKWGEVIATIGAAILMLPIKTNACTAYVCKNKSGAVILAKNRDSSVGAGYTRQKDMARYWTQDLRMFKAKGKYEYVALMYSQQSTEGKRVIISSGINECGLSVTYNRDNAQKTMIKESVGSIARDASNVAKRILENASTVAEAKKQIEMLKEQKKLAPMFIAISDKRDYSIVEIAATNLRSERPETVDQFKLKIWYKEPKDGAIYVTNHFDHNGELDEYNYERVELSETRFKRIKKLMEGICGINESTNPDENANYSLEVAMTCAKDHHDGEICSINRESTKALFITESSNDRPSKLFIEFTSPAQIYNRAEIVLDDAFWNKYEDDEPIVAHDVRYLSPEGSKVPNSTQ